MANLFLPSKEPPHGDNKEGSPIRQDNLRIYEEDKMVIKDLLKKDTFVALATDIWSSINTTAFISITVHFLDNSSNLVQKCISCKSFFGSHSGTNIGELLNKKAMEFGLIH
ncbi:unnamed protein product [Lepeophtheirus salmonis]|uniref:(salmon louse) hypothetical protein n=1 Tax=Lepeophtheirus salmonis TaxID=72036 RepID=A0A7R8GYN3_LEPSM|nr:unnamed protein product [Lepeophtheirus salmonis]CAF2750098.1 unnamed protein product [Lepeophtheirus salmonis]